jgi:hypothetical protein
VKSRHHRCMGVLWHAVGMHELVVLTGGVACTTAFARYRRTSNHRLIAGKPSNVASLGIGFGEVRAVTPSRCSDRTPRTGPWLDTVGHGIFFDVEADFGFGRLGWRREQRAEFLVNIAQCGIVG